MGGGRRDKFYPYKKGRRKGGGVLEQNVITCVLEPKSAQRSPEMDLVEASVQNQFPGGQKNVF